MSRETILSFDPSVSPGKYTIVPVINAAAVMLTSWSTCVTFQLWKSQAIPSPQFIIGFLPAIHHRSPFTGLYIMQEGWGRCGTHVNMVVIYTTAFYLFPSPLYLLLAGAIFNTLGRAFVMNKI